MIGDSGSMIKRAIVGAPAVAAIVYAATIAVFLALIWSAVADIQERRAGVAATAEILAQLQGRRPLSPGPGASGDATQTGSPFLEGPTVTVAGATLLQRVATAVGNVGGTIQSSQVDVVSTQAKDGFVGLVVSCEMEQPALQKLLYDLEVGMPFLFVDQLDVQVPQTTSQNEDGTGRIRVMLGVSGQWQGSK